MVRFIRFKKETLEVSTFSTRKKAN